MAMSPSVPICTGKHALLNVASATGEAYCFNCMVEEHQMAVFRLAVSFLRDHSLADDAAQETFISAYRSFSQFRGGALRSWLLRIAANVCRDMLRSAKARPAASLDALPVMPEDPAPQGDTPEAATERAEFYRVLRSALAKLPDEQRQVVELVDIQGLSYDEAAEAMDTRVGTVKSRLARARIALRDLLAPHRELFPSRFRQEGEEQ
jgi:RNA polymerase sigma-70 factor (ECF subfamily)